MGSIGLPEILLILLAVLLLFGAKKIPEVMRSFGQGIREFKKATTAASDDIRRAVEDPEPEPKKSGEA